MTASEHVVGAEFEQRSEQALERWPPQMVRIKKEQASSEVNVGGGERIVSGAAGLILLLQGLKRLDLTGLLIAGVGGGLLYRGATGHCSMYQSLGIDTAKADGREQLAPSRGTRVTQSYLIDRSPEELYAYWRHFENLPNIMTHLRSVQVTGDGRSHWVAKAPRMVGGQVEWDAEITEDEPNSRIAWRSLPGGDVMHRGSIEFKRAPADRGTAVKVVMEYRPPAGQLGRWLAKIFGEEPEQQIREDLRNFKRFMELGELPTIAGQPRGTCLLRGRRHSG